MKKIISIALAITLLLSLGAMSVSAADPTIDGTPNTGDSTVTYTFTSSYTVTIPEFIPANITTPVDITATVTALDIGTTEKLQISRTADTTTLPLSDGGTGVATATIAGTASVDSPATTVAGTEVTLGTIIINGKPTIGGSYSGTITFTCAVS